jgi:hypothetical protein
MSPLLLPLLLPFMRPVPGLVVLLCPLLLVAAPARAGQTCTMQPLTAREIERGMALAQATAQALEASGAQVVVLARAGQDLSRYGQTWSHLGCLPRAQPPAGVACGA